MRKSCMVQEDEKLGLIDPFLIQLTATLPGKATENAFTKPWAPATRRLLTSALHSICFFSFPRSEPCKSFL